MYLFFSALKCQTVSCYMCMLRHVLNKKRTRFLQRETKHILLYSLTLRQYVLREWSLSLLQSACVTRLQR